MGVTLQQAVLWIDLLDDGRPCSLVFALAPLVLLVIPSILILYSFYLASFVLPFTHNGTFETRRL
jgi:hypothetical protein